MSASALLAQPGSVQRELRTKASDPVSTELSPKSGVLQDFDAERISQLAYSLWQQRGCPTGSANEDWLEAERQLSSPSQN